MTLPCYAWLKGTLSRYIGEKFSYLLMFTEPIGSKSPTFSTDDKLAWFVRPVDHSIALICPAQAYPIPIFR